MLTSCHEYWHDDEVYSYTETEYIYEEYDDCDEDDPSGGLDYWSSYYKGSSRSFFGSYELNEYYSTCDDYGYDDPDLELPTYLDVYSYDDMMDFETSSGQLIWNAVIYSDDTFEFETNYLDWYGHPSVIFPCECEIYNIEHSDESIECVCEPSNTYSTCYFYYELI